MTSIGAIGSTATAVTPVYRVAARSVDSTPTPTVDPAQRASQLSRQLDAQLTYRLSRIRQQITPDGDGAAGAQPASNRLDIQA